MIGVADDLRNGGIGVIPTDTIYGVVGTALRPDTVELLYKVRGRSPEKPFIILISKVGDLHQFDIYPDEQVLTKLNEFWPGPVTVVLPCPYEKFEYLHRGTKTLAFRLPDKADLVALINQVGPLVAPSANPEGMSPAQTITQARSYFGRALDFYVDGGTIIAKPSTILEIKNGEIKTLR